MPYSIRAVPGDGYTVINTDTGAVKAKHTSHANAEKQVRLLYALEHGMTPAKRPGSYHGLQHDQDALSHKNAVAGKY
jgi:hypothetical protein